MTPTDASPLTAEELGMARRVLAEIERVNDLGRDPSMTDGDWENLQGAIDSGRAWLATIDTLTRENQELQAQVGVLVTFADKVRCMTTGGKWQEMLDNDIELMKEANALCSNLPASAQAFLAEKGAAEAESARLREALPTLEQWERFVEGFLDTTPDGFTDSEMANAIVARIDRALSDATTKALGK
jgi:hypothetical protein